MIIESSFYRVLEVVQNNSHSDDLLEAGIVNLFSNSVLLELNARNASNPMRTMQLEKRYTFIEGQKKRCDLYFDVTNVHSKEMEAYGCFSKNWIEVKYFGNYRRTLGTSTTITKSENIGKIIDDLCRLGEQSISSCKNNEGYYSLVMFKSPKEKYLAISEPKAGRKEFLSIFNSGINEVNLNLDEEVHSVKKALSVKGRVCMKIRTTVFEPLNEDSDLFYGYLFQILEYKKIAST